MSQNQLLPVWLIQNGNMSGNLTSQNVELEFMDNIGIHVVWTGTPTGTLSVQISLDPTNLGWVSIPFTSPTQPSGSGGSDYFEVNQSTAAYVRLIYTAASGSGTLNAKIAIKSV